ncbi:hypothetical protein ANO14919_097400 [Xylariales sp. No.14919]|nr:hypothetical protein ANO14919_097400 [Xylariales sp. No.14919]
MSLGRYMSQATYKPSQPPRLGLGDTDSEAEPSTPSSDSPMLRTGRREIVDEFPKTRGTIG